MGTAKQQVIDRYTDWRWRLNHLYQIKDETGHQVTFKMNWAQEALFDGMHYANVILKARQLGFTTFIQLFMLDQCLFNKNIRAGTVAHTLDSAKEIFREKIKFAYDNLAPELREAIPAKQDAADTLTFANGSSLIVGTSLRSGTYQYLHISELGYISAHYPEKAEEIRTGALNTVHPGQIVFIESTAKGKLGLFHEICEDAQELQRQGAELGLLDYKFHFFPWWRHPGYRLDESPPEGLKTRAYFRALERHGIALTDAQKAWYAKKARTQGRSIKSEFPSTPEEAFEGAEGIFFDCFDRDLHVVRPFRIPAHWTRFRSEDWGTARPFSIGWWAVASETVRTPCDRIIPRGALIKYREWYGVQTDEAGRVLANTGIKSTPQRVGKGIVEREAEGEILAYHVADPAMWQDQGGPSQAEQQHDAIKEWSKRLAKPHSDVIWRKGNNQRTRRGKAKGGWDQMRERMLGEDLGEGVERPMIFWFGSCIHSIRTIPSLLHDEHQPEDVDTNGEDHAADECFAPGTLVDTAEGPRRIETLTNGLVHSISGLETYTARLTHRNARVIKLTFGDMRSIICTPDHRFLTADGWIAARDMKGRICQRSSAPQSRNSAEFDITAAAHTFSAKVCGFTGWFGKMLTGRLPRAGTSITRTMTAPTTPWRIWNYRKLARILATTARSMADASMGWLPRVLPLPNGMALSMVGPGTQSTTGDTAQQVLTPGKHRSVSAAEKNMLLCTASNSADQRVSKHGIEHKESSRRHFSVPFAEILSKVTSIVQTRLVAVLAAASYQVISVEGAGKSDVYCLSVPTTEAFSVNGMVVHNCRYACMSRPYETPKPPDKKPMTDLSNVTMNQLWQETERRFDA